MTPFVQIEDCVVGEGGPTFVIAEAGVNHNGELVLAKQLVEAACAAGADAVKFQSFKADRLATTNAPTAAYQRRQTNSPKSQVEMLQRLELSLEAHRELSRYCRAKGIIFLSTPFDASSADMLADLGVPAFKIASGELTNLPFLAHVARFGKPLLISTGMSYLSEVEAALRTVREAGNQAVVLLHCVSDYPAEPADANLRAMQTLRAAFGAPVGFSDHTLGTSVALAAVALGACVVEKHLTLDRNLPGPDHQASLGPMEFQRLVEGIRTVEAALGTGIKQPTERERAIAAVARRSLVTNCDIPAGTVLEASMVEMKRPGTGLPFAALSYLIGRRVRWNIPQGTLVTAEMFE